MDDAFVEMIANRVLASANSSLIGRAWEADDAKQRQEFVEWYLEMADRLDLDVTARSGTPDP